MTDTLHAIVWYKNGVLYHLTDANNEAVLLTSAEVVDQLGHFILSEDEVELAKKAEGQQHGIPVDLLEDLFGVSL